jgi:hypothetical protein
MNMTWFLFGVVTGLLIAALYCLGQLTRYVSSDIDAFTKWLDRTP